MVGPPPRAVNERRIGPQHGKCGSLAWMSNLQFPSSPQSMEQGLPLMVFRMPWTSAAAGCARHKALQALVGAVRGVARMQCLPQQEHKCGKGVKMNESYQGSRSGIHTA